MSDTAIEREEVLRIAALAKLQLDDNEVLNMRRELGAILAHMQALQAVDVSGIELRSHVQLARMPLREDSPRPSLERQDVLAEAPHAHDEGFAVPTFVDEG